MFFTFLNLLLLHGLASVGYGKYLFYFSLNKIKTEIRIVNFFLIMISLLLLFFNFSL